MAGHWQQSTASLTPASIGGENRIRSGSNGLLWAACKKDWLILTLVLRMHILDSWPSGKRRSPHPHGRPRMRHVWEQQARRLKVSDLQLSISAISGGGF